MDILTLLLIVLIPLAIILYFQQQKKQKIKSAVVKKSEIIESYKNQMREVLKLHKDDSSKLISEKTKLLKKINYELSMNLFFDEEESKKLLKELLELN